MKWLKSKDVCLCFLTFVLSLVIRLWFNFVDVHPVNAFACDASEYMRNARAFLSLFEQPLSFYQSLISMQFGCLGAQECESVKNILAGFAELAISGPIFPLYILSSFMIVGCKFNMLAYQPPVFLQSVVSSLSSVFVLLTAKRLYGRQAGVIAGLIAAFYPGFIVNSGRLYSESFATFLLSMILYLCVGSLSNFSRYKPGSIFGIRLYWACLALGFLSACLQLTRSVMVLFTALILVFMLYFFRHLRPLKALGFFLIGFALVYIPWMGFQKACFGKANFVVDRVGHYNFFIGNHIDTQGFLSYPYPDGRGVEDKGLVQLAKEQIELSPARWLKLISQDKLPRLLKAPWNDFRTSIGSFSYLDQVYFHQLILILACLALICRFCTEPFANINVDRHSLFIARGLIFAALSMHAVYIFFITVPRYNLTAIPELIIFAAAGADFLLQLTRRGYFFKLVLPILGLIAFFLSCHFNSGFFLLTTASNGQINFDLMLFLLVVFKLIACGLFAYFCLYAQRQLSQNTNSRELSYAKLMATMLALILFPSLCLPARANGRLGEFGFDMSGNYCYGGSTSANRSLELVFSFDLDKDKLDKHGYLAQGGTIQNDNRQEQSLDQLILNNSGGQPFYLALDIEGAGAIRQVDLSVNQSGGILEDVPLLPELGLLETAPDFKQLDSKQVYLECEYIFYCLSYAAGITNRDLRQWYLVPVDQRWFKQEVLKACKHADKNGKSKLDLKVTLKLAPQKFEYLKLFAESCREKIKSTEERSYILPGHSLYSWEKAFYGVENDFGLSDSRFDQKVNAIKSPADTNSISFARVTVPASTACPYGTKLNANLFFPQSYIYSDVLERHRLGRFSKNTLSLCPLSGAEFMQLVDSPSDLSQGYVLNQIALQRKQRLSDCCTVSSSINDPAEDNTLNGFAFKLPYMLNNDNSVQSQLAPGRFNEVSLLKLNFHLERNSSSANNRQLDTRLWLVVYCRNTDGSLLTYFSPWLSNSLALPATSHGEDYSYTLPLYLKALPARPEFVELISDSADNLTISGVSMDLITLGQTTTLPGYRIEIAGQK